MKIVTKIKIEKRVFFLKYEINFNRNRANFLEEVDTNFTFRCSL